MRRDAGPSHDAGPRDAGPPRDAGQGDRDGGLVDGGTRDAGSPDSGAEDAGERVVAIEVAYAATAEEPLLAHLYLTESSTTRVRLTPALAGGPTTGGKGEPVVAGVGRFEWTRDGAAIFYAAQQDTYDLYELYLTEELGSQRSTKMSVANGTGGVREWTRSPSSSWVTFPQSVPGATITQRFAVRLAPGSTPVQISAGSAGTPWWSPVADELVFQDIIVSADDRDLWHVNLAVAPPVRTRVNPGSYIGFGGAASWSADGEEIAYSADESALRQFELYRASVRGGEVGLRERVTDPFPANADIIGADKITFAPSGSNLAFIADLDTDNLDELYVVDTANALPAAPTKLSLPFPAGADGVEAFVWSEDGTRIVYQADNDTADRPDLYITDLTGGSAIRINDAVPENGAANHPRFVRGDSLVVYTQYDGNDRHAYVVDVTTSQPGAPIDLGLIHPFFPSARYALSPSEDYLVHPTLESPPRLVVTDLTQSPPTSIAFETYEDLSFSDDPTWCWSPDDELLIIGPDGHLYLVEDLATGDLFRISGRLVADGRVTACAFPPRQVTR